MNTFTDNSIFLARTGVSSFTLKNEAATQQPSGSQTGTNDHVERILINAGFEISNTVSFRRFLMSEIESGTSMVWLPRLIKNHFKPSEYSSVEIEIMMDPEDDEPTPEAYVLIETSLPVEDANANLYAMNKDLLSWGKKTSKINIILNYV